MRQEKFIKNLSNALIRIENKTYGICRVTGKLISKERLKLVPHATLSIEAKKTINTLKKVYLTTFIILLLDQLSKYWVKTNMYLGEEILIFDWFRLHYIENNGMAYGIELGGEYGKLFLTLFRICVVIWGVFLCT